VNPKWSSKFELKPGRWVFVPTDEARLIGKHLKSAVEKVWTPPEFFYHLRRGGHVEAMRLHTGNTRFLKVDIENFFGSINKSRVTRALKSKFGYPQARSWANASIVRDPQNGLKSILPFGFVQSQLLASLCLWESHLGRCIQGLAAHPDLAVSVYVDDIIVSTQSEDLSKVYASLGAAAARGGFTLNAAKTQGPAPSITAFNIVLCNASLAVEDNRIQEFLQDLAAMDDGPRRAGVIGYVASVNLEQAAALKP
jgi:hypothetical protein